MNIKGKYRDVLIGSKSHSLLMDPGWQSNNIVPDYGRFLAALMKKDLPGLDYLPMGIDYIAVGNDSSDLESFKSMISDYFNKDKNKDFPAPYRPDPNKDPWVWAKEIQASNINYLDEKGKSTRQITDQLKIDITFAENEPGQGTFIFTRFALLGIQRKMNGKNIEYNTYHMFLINFVHHGEISKDNSMKLNRTIKLTFPLEPSTKKNDKKY